MLWIAIAASTAGSAESAMSVGTVPTIALQSRATQQGQCARMLVCMWPMLVRRPQSTSPRVTGRKSPSLSLERHLDRQCPTIRVARTLTCMFRVPLCSLVRYDRITWSSERQEPLPSSLIARVATTGTRSVLRASFPLRFALEISLFVVFL